MSLVVAGNETTRHLMSGSFIEMAARPDARDALWADVTRIPGAVEECLRWVTPIQQFARTATRDTELGGVAVARRGLPRDALRLRQPGRGGRSARRRASSTSGASPARANLAFGFGQHLCLGAALARMEARVLFEELAARRSTFSQAGEAEYLPSSLVRGPHTLPMVFH